MNGTYQVIEIIIILITKHKYDENRSESELLVKYIKYIENM